MGKLQWRKRTHGTRRQLGKSFILLPSQQKLKSRLPMISGKKRFIKRLIVPTANPCRKVLLSLKHIDLSKLVPSEKKPIDLERRAQYFVDMHNEGRTIPPILIHKLRDGSYQILDGHARVHAYRKLGIAKIPAVENEEVTDKDFKKAKEYVKEITDKPVAIISSKPDVLLGVPSRVGEVTPVILKKPKTEVKAVLTEEYKARERKAVEKALLAKLPEAEKPKTAEELLEERKEFHRARVRKAGIKLGKAEKELVTGVPREFLKLSDMYEAAKQGRTITVNIHGIPTEIPASQIRAILSDRQRAAAGEYYLEPIELKAFATRPWTTRPPLLEGAGSPFTKPPTKQYRRRKKKGKRFEFEGKAEFEGKGRVH
jgi:ParB-like chromosome segregation protein Spo0J